MHKKHPIGRLIGIVKGDVDQLDNNPRIQLKIHTVGFWYWTINFPIITYMFFFQQALWLKYGLFITLIYSIYANWTSDYTGMSSSQSVINTEKVEIDNVENVNINDSIQPPSKTS